MEAGRHNLVLIGMPGTGKSTLGVLLAKEVAKTFVDTDLLIQERAGATLQQIVDEQGYELLRQLEEEVLCSLNVRNCVVATGGSAVYSEAAMMHLKQQGTCIHLRLPLPGIEARVHNLSSRGLAAAPGSSLAEVYAERRPLYEKYADLTLDCDGRPVEELVQQLKALAANKHL